MAGIIRDRPKDWWSEVISQPLCAFMHDWESGIDCLDSIQSSIKQHFE